MIGTLVGVAAASVLLFAGAWKLAAPEEMRSTLRALRFPSASIATFVLGLLELGSAAALVVFPDIGPAVLAVIALGFGFAAAGVFTIVRRIGVKCACFGPILAGQLGIRQILALPVWLAVAVLVTVDPSPFARDERARLFLAVILLLGVVAVFRLVPPYREHNTLVRALSGR